MLFQFSGVLTNGRVRCPWHGACFNVATGDIEDFPGLDSLPKFQVKIHYAAPKPPHLIHYTTHWSVSCGTIVSGLSSKLSILIPSQTLGGNTQGIAVLVGCHLSKDALKSLIPCFGAQMVGLWQRFFAD